MNEHNDWALLAKYYAQECSEEERARAEALMKSDPKAQHLISLLEADGDGADNEDEVGALWASVAERTGIRDTSKELPGEKSKHDAEVPLFQKVFVGVWRYAAVLFIAGGLTYFMSGDKMRDFLFWESPHQTVVVNATSYGERRLINLPDGTHVTLDAGSKLSYPESFVGDRREVMLEGKAYFDVVAQEEHPFVVRANQGVVEVLGTEFSVSAWPELERVDVVVAEGRVALNSQDGLNGHGSILGAGQMGTLMATGILTTPKPVDLSIYLGWMRNVVAFQDVPLREVLFHLERQFDVKIALEDTSVAGERLTIRINHPSLQEALEVVCTLTSLRYDLSKKHVRLFRR